MVGAPFVFGAWGIGDGPLDGRVRGGCEGWADGGIGGWSMGEEAWRTGFEVCHIDVEGRIGGCSGEFGFGRVGESDGRVIRRLPTLAIACCFSFAFRVLACMMIVFFVRESDFFSLVRESSMSWCVWMACCSKCLASF
jgi:hypothetical protein